MQSLSQLLRPITLEEARQFMIDVLVSVGFKTAASWADGSLARTCAIEVPSEILVDVSATIATVAKGGYNDTAEDDWLTLLSISAYDNERKPAVRARGPATLTSVPSAPPHTIQPDYLVASDSIGHTFRNKTGGTLAPGGTLTLVWESELAGEAGNIIAGSLTRLQTTLAGVTINNPGAGGVWLTRLGTNEESDEALRTRNRTKWATRALHAPEDAYKFWALESAVEITRAEVNSDNPSGPGSLRIYIAGTTGALPSSLATVCRDYIYGDGPDGIVRRAPNAFVECVCAQERAVLVTGTVYQSAAYAATVRSGVEQNLKVLDNTLPIGGSKIDVAARGRLMRSALYGAVMRVPGVMNFDLQTPAADVELDEDEVAVLTLDIQYRTV